MVSPESTLWHALDKDVVMQMLSSTPEGLSEIESKNRLSKYGKNILNFQSSANVVEIFLRQIRNPIVYLLLFATVLALVLGKFTDAFVVIAVVFLNSLIGFFQEYKAYKTIQSLTSLLPLRSNVIRRNVSMEINASDIVPGDIVVLQSGDRIPADLRLFYSKNLFSDESILTGESLPVSKTVEVLPENTVIADQKNMLFNGSHVTSGSGLGVAVATGMKTEFGKIARLVEQVTSLETPMSITVAMLAHWITLGVIGLGLLLFLVAYLRGSDMFEAAFSAVTLAVAAVPEGLPAIFTITASIGVMRMARRQAIVRQLPAVEALGSTSIICTDKTGTLTYNEMMVQQMWTSGGFSFLTGAGYSLEGHLQDADFSKAEEVEQLLKAAVLCNEASINELSGTILPVGDPTEVALIVAGRKVGLNEENLRQSWTRVDVIPFESEKRYMATLYSSPDHQKWIFIKGAPEEIMTKCNLQTHFQQVLLNVQNMAKEGMRVLAIAQKEATALNDLNESNLDSGFTLLGLVGMMDPARKEVYKALQSCHSAGISVKMVTGDHPLTASAIAKELGILKLGKVITGAELAKLSAEEWKSVSLNTEVFARVSPEHKLKLVEALQAYGHVVTMTGDGVNDAAALKRADIGVAMGIKGTAIAKEAADIVLADDNFATIEAAVEEGRRVYDNLIKALFFVLPTSIGLAMVVFLAMLFFPVNAGILLHPMSPPQVLWINLVVAVALSLSLAFEPSEDSIMSRPPRKKHDFIISVSMGFKMLSASLFMSLGVLALFTWEYQKELAINLSPQLALSESQTMAVTSMILFQICYLLICKNSSNTFSFKKFMNNRYLFVGIVVVVALQLSFIYTKIMNQLFHTSPLDLESLIASSLVALLIIPYKLIESVILKFIDRK